MGIWDIENKKYKWSEVSKYFNNYYISPDMNYLINRDKDNNLYIKNI